MYTSHSLFLTHLCLAAYEKVLCDQFDALRIVCDGVVGPRFWIRCHIRGKGGGEDVHLLQEHLQERVSTRYSEWVDQDVFRVCLMMQSNALEYLRVHQIARTPFDGADECVYPFLCWDRGMVRIEGVEEIQEQIPPQFVGHGITRCAWDVETRELTVEGVLCNSAKEVRQVQKRCARLRTHKYKRLLWDQEGVLVTPLGMQRIDQVQQDYLQELESSNLRCASIGIDHAHPQPNLAHRAFWRLRPPRSQVLYSWITTPHVDPVFFDTSTPLDLSYGLQDIQTRFFPKNRVREEVSSCLQFIEKMSKMSNFRFRWVMLEGLRSSHRNRKAWKKHHTLLQEVLRDCCGSDVSEVTLAQDFLGPALGMIAVDPLGTPRLVSEICFPVFEEHEMYCLVLTVFKSLQQWIGLEELYFEN